MAVDWMYSGAMYPGVPKICWLPVSEGASMIFAMPKSRIFTSSSVSRVGTRSTFSGFRSRWTTPI